jgi:hypothetical protein
LSGADEHHNVKTAQDYGAYKKRKQSGATDQSCHGECGKYPKQKHETKFSAMARELHVPIPASFAAIKADRYGEHARIPRIRRKCA